MMHQAFSKFTPLLDVPLGDGSSSKWFLGPWGRDDYMKQLQDFKRSEAFAPIESNWERSCAEHLLKMYEQCCLTWVIARSKDQKSFGADITGERVGPSLFNLDPHGLLKDKGYELRKMGAQAALKHQRDQARAGQRFRDQRQRGFNERENEQGFPAETAEQRRGGASSVMRNPLTGTPPNGRGRGAAPSSEPRMRGSSSSARQLDPLQALGARGPREEARRTAAPLSDGRVPAAASTYRAQSSGGALRSPNFEENIYDMAAAIEAAAEFLPQRAGGARSGTTASASMMADLFQDVEIDSAEETNFDLPPGFRAPQVSAAPRSPIAAQEGGQAGQLDAEEINNEFLNEDQAQGMIILEQISLWKDRQEIDEKDVDGLMAYVKATTAMFNATVELQVAYLQALKYFCREILSQELIDAVNDLRVQREIVLRDRLTWRDIAHVILGYMKDLSAPAALLAFIHLLRGEGTACKHWLDLQRAYRNQLTMKGFAAPESFWLPFAVNQMSHQERTLLRVPADTDLNSIDLAAIADALETVDRNRLGRYVRGCGLLSNLYAASLPLNSYKILTATRAQRPGTDSNWNTPQPREPRPNDNLNARAHEVRSQSKTLKIAAPASKEQRQKWKREGKCLRCGSSQHQIRDCPLEPSAEERACREGKLNQEREVRFHQKPDNEREREEGAGEQTCAQAWENSLGGDSLDEQSACTSEPLSEDQDFDDCDDEASLDEDRFYF